MLVLRFDEFTYLCFQDAKFNLAQIGLALAFCTTTFAAFLFSPLASAAHQQPACASLHQLCPTHAAGRRGKEKGGSHSTPRPAAHAVLTDTRAPPPALHEVARASRREPPAEQTVRASWRNLPPPPFFFLEEIVK